MFESDYSELVTNGLRYVDKGMNNAYNIMSGDIYCTVSRDERHLRLFIQCDIPPFRDLFNGIEVSSSVQNPRGSPPVDGLEIVCPASYEKQFILLSDNLIGSVLESGIDFDPQDWCDDWKVVFGNVYSESRVYDVISEMIALGFCQPLGDVVWAGPDGGRHDVLCRSFDCEIKSTTRRTGPPTVSVSSLQMKSDERPLKLLVIILEEAANGVFSISSLKKALISGGIDRSMIDDGLEKTGIKTTKLQKKAYNVLKMMVFDVGDDFPSLDESEYSGGKYPNGIVDVRYSIVLSGLRSINYSVSIEEGLLDFRELSDD